MNTFRVGERVMVGPDTSKPKLAGSVGYVRLVRNEICTVALEDKANTRWSFMPDELLPVVTATDPLASEEDRPHHSPRHAST